MYNEDTKAKSKIGKGGKRRLVPITKKFEDGSTPEDFRFTFFCDLCGKAVKTITYPYTPPFKAKLFISASERRARELIWQSDHASAYDRANQEALLSLNHCSVCGKRVCDDCFDEEEGICPECACKRESYDGYTNTTEFIKYETVNTFSADVQSIVTASGISTYTPLAE